MNLRNLGLITGFVSIFGSAQCLAQNAYITNGGSGSVSIIDTATNTVTKTIAFPVDSQPAGVAVVPDGSKVYITNLGSNSVSVIDTDTNTVRNKMIPVGRLPIGVAVTPDGGKVYVTNNGSDNVSVIATKRNAVIKTIPVGIAPFGVAVTPDGSKVYVVNSVNASSNHNAEPSTVSVIDTERDRVTKMVPVGFGPTSVVIAHNGERAYVSGHDPVTFAAIFSVIETATDEVIATVSVGSNGAADVVVITPDDSRLYAGNNEEGVNTVLVIDIASERVVATIPVGINPYGMAITPDGKRVYVANNFSNTVSVIDTEHNVVIRTVAVGGGPIAFGNFIQPLPRFAGTPGKSNCYGRSVSALVRQFHGLQAAAAALEFSSIEKLQDAISEFCEA